MRERAGDEADPRALLHIERHKSAPGQRRDGVVGWIPILTENARAAGAAQDAGGAAARGRKDLIEEKRARTAEKSAAAALSFRHVAERYNRDKTEAAYARGDLFEKRRRLMSEWAAFCQRVVPTPGEVVPLRAWSVRAGRLRATGGMRERCANTPGPGPAIEDCGENRGRDRGL
jgi:hypothetical protein